MTRSQRITLAILLCATAAFCGKAAAETVALEPGKLFARELSGGQEHSYEIQLAEGQYTSVIVEQRGIDVTLQLFGMDGELLLSIDEELKNQGQEKMDLVGEGPGSYQLIVRTSSLSAPTGLYDIRIGDIREAHKNDRLLYEARRMEVPWRKAYLAGQYEDARRFAEQALAIIESVSGKQNRAYIAWLYNLGEYYEKKQDFAKCLSLREEAVEQSTKTLGEEHPLTILFTRALAYTYYETNENIKSEQLASRALELSEKTLGPEHYLVARCLGTLGVITKDRPKAAVVLNRALLLAEKILGPESDFYGTVSNSIGQHFLNEGEFDKAESFLLRAQAIHDKTQGPANVSRSMICLNLGMTARMKKDYVKAEEQYSKGITIVEKAFGPDNPRLAMFFNNLANIYRAKGEYATSLEMHQRVLRISEATRGPYHPLTLVSLGNIAKTYAAQGNIEDAILFQKRVDTTIEHNIDLNIAVGSERQKLAYLNSMAERTDRTISLSVDIAPDNPAAGALAALVVLQRKGRVLDAMSESFASLRQRSSPEERALLEKFNETTAQLARLVLDGPKRTSFEEHQKAIAELEKQKEKLESEISLRSEEFRSQSLAVTLSSVQALIPSDAALIEFAVYRPFDPKAENNNEAYKEPRYVAYVLRQQGDVRWRDLGEAKLIDAAIDNLRIALRDPKSSNIRQEARIVDESIMQPVRSMLSESTHLIVSPDGAINFVPLEALIDEQNRYLIERFTFTYLTSGRDLLRLQVSRQSKTPAVVMANPAFGEPDTVANTGSDRATSSDFSDIYFAPLAGSAQEAIAIKTLFPEADILTAARATESTLKSASAPRILHIATHGFFLTGQQAAGVEGTRSISANAKIDNPLLRSGLALAGANLQKSSNDDGILSALEASALNLWGTKLVTLSACDTGVGEVKSGEGVFGLRRAFVLAGTETLVMSLWPVSDYITRELMASYYSGLKQGIGRGQALRKVQLSMLQRKGREHPFYWAGFVQSGEWANLDGKR